MATEWPTRKPALDEFGDSLTSSGNRVGDSDASMLGSMLGMVVGGSGQSMVARLGVRSRAVQAVAGEEFAEELHAVGFPHAHDRVEGAPTRLDNVRTGVRSGDDKEHLGYAAVLADAVKLRCHGGQHQGRVTRQGRRDGVYVVRARHSWTLDLQRHKPVVHVVVGGLLHEDRHLFSAVEQELQPLLQGILLSWTSQACRGVPGCQADVEAVVLAVCVDDLTAAEVEDVQARGLGEEGEDNLRNVAVEVIVEVRPAVDGWDVRIVVPGILPIEDVVIGELAIRDVPIRDVPIRSVPVRDVPVRNVSIRDVSIWKVRGRLARRPHVEVGHEAVFGVAVHIGIAGGRSTHCVAAVQGDRAELVDGARAGKVRGRGMGDRRLLRGKIRGSLERRVGRLPRWRSRWHLRARETDAEQTFRRLTAFWELVLHHEHDIRRPVKGDSERLLVERAVEIERSRRIDGVAIVVAQDQAVPKAAVCIQLVQVRPRRHLRPAGFEAIEARAVNCDWYVDLLPLVVVVIVVFNEIRRLVDAVKAGEGRWDLLVDDARAGHREGIPVPNRRPVPKGLPRALILVACVDEDFTADVDGARRVYLVARAIAEDQLLPQLVFHDLEEVHSGGQLRGTRGEGVVSRTDRLVGEVDFGEGVVDVVVVAHAVRVVRRAGLIVTIPYRIARRGAQGSVAN
eukprot:scaffold844_cov254-Pinguiococcus_pyrenoidosus.AAC.11